MISSKRSVPGRPGGHGGKLTSPEKRARRAGDVRLGADLLHGRDGSLGLRPAPRAQIDLGDGAVGDDVGSLAAAHGARR